MSPQAQWRTTLVYYGAFIILGLSSAILGPTLSALADFTHSTVAQVSGVLSAVAFGTLLGSLLAGPWYTRWPAHRVLGLALLSMAALLALLPYAPNGLWLLGLGLAMGITHALVDVGGNTLLPWLHGEKVGPWMNGMHFSFGLGAFLAPMVLAQVLLRDGDARLAYLLLALAALPVWLALTRVQTPPRPASLLQPAPQTTAPWSFVLSLALLLFLYVGVEVSFGGWIYTYATVSGRLADPVRAAYLTSGFWGMLTVGRLLAVFLARRWRPPLLLVGDMALALLSLGALLLIPTPTALVLGTLGLGLALASFFPSTVTYAGRRGPLEATRLRWLFVGSGLGGTVLPWIMGQVFERAGVMALPWVIESALGMLTLGLVLVLVRQGDWWYPWRDSNPQRRA